MKYRPSNFDGNPDLETAALLEALINPTGPLPPPLPAPVTTSPILLPGMSAPAPVPSTPTPTPDAVPATPPVPTGQ
jgi:N-acetylmuramoyl-L-alanine amidase